MSPAIQVKQKANEPLPIEAIFGDRKSRIRAEKLITEERQKRERKNLLY